MRDLTVGYDRIPLIKNINLGVRPGEILTLIGPNGSGKSTILKTITKQLKTIGGSVFLGKESMRELTDSEISRHLSMVMTERIHGEAWYPLTTGLEKGGRGDCPGACRGSAAAGFQENQ